MRQLDQDLTSEPHNTDADMTTYFEVSREFLGRTMKFEVEAFITYDGGELDCLYFGRIPFHTHLTDGFGIMEDSFLMLSEAEMQDILGSQEVKDFVKECNESEEHVKEHNAFYDASR